MKKYTKIYLKAINELTNDNSNFVGCEVCGNRASEIHHILNKNRLIEMNLLDKKDELFNIMAICRGCHNKYGDRNTYVPLLLKIHIKRMLAHNKELDSNLCTGIIEKYS